ncbi:MAG: sulfatase [Planctomycetota bacterium]|nr:MAG: sulfatase [Planctomycetota bacterium]
MSANFGCYGEKTIETPNVNRMARDGTRFAKAFTTAPVCSPSRSALVTGRYQTSIGAHHHRSGRGADKIVLPEGVETVPALFRRAGYFTSIGSWPIGKQQGKTDYNFEWESKSVYDGTHWADRKPGQPFFAQVQLHGGKYRGNGRTQSDVVKKALGTFTAPEAVALPPYYPDDPVIRQDWAHYLDTVRYTDLQLGQILKRLEEDGVAANTLVFFITDHGISHARGKQFLYDEGAHIPLVVRGPGAAAGAVRTDLVSHIDLAATSLAAAGIDLPKGMHSQDLFAKDYRARDAVFAARDRCDETVEHLRMARTAKWKYIRNFLPKRPHLQPNAYKDGKAIVKRLRELHGSGQLTGLPRQLLFAPERAPEELYDLEADPFEVRNLAADPSHEAALKEMRGRLDRWMEETGDQGSVPEAEKRYDSDMAVYLKEGSKSPEALKILEANIALMKKWAAEGK